MTENMKKFLELVSQNEELAKRMNNASKEDVLAIAKELGVELTDADFAQNSELSDDELDAVAGGGDCYCVIGGGGTADDNDSTCACVAFGNGAAKRYVGINGSCIRCTCAAGGWGADT